MKSLLVLLSLSCMVAATAPLHLPPQERERVMQCYDAHLAEQRLELYREARSEIGEEALSWTRWEWVDWLSHHLGGDAASLFPLAHEFVLAALGELEHRITARTDSLEELLGSEDSEWRQLLEMRALMEAETLVWNQLLRGKPCEELLAQLDLQYLTGSLDFVVPGVRHDVNLEWQTRYLDQRELLEGVTRQMQNRIASGALPLDRERVAQEILSHARMRRFLDDALHQVGDWAEQMAHICRRTQKGLHARLTPEGREALEQLPLLDFDRS